MKLESEFHLCLDRYLLEQAFQQNDCCPPVFYASTWVKLARQLTAFSADEALLLCQASETEWVAWVPDYGEILLTLDQINES